MSSPSPGPGDTVAAQIRRMYRRFGPRPALYHRGEWIDFDAVDALAARVAARLESRGALAGDRVVIALRNSAALRVLELAALEYGRVRAAVSPRLHPREIAAIVADSGARAVFCSAAEAARIGAALAEAGLAPALIAVDEEAPLEEGLLEEGLLEEGALAEGPLTDGLLADGPPATEGRGTPGAPGVTAAPGRAGHGEGAAGPAVAPGDLAMLLYSSGTTGEPKAATVTHRAWVAQTAYALERLPPIGPGDTVLAVAPMTHFGGSIGLDAMIRGAATVPVHGFEPARVLAAIAEHGVSILPLAPIMLARLALAVEEAGAPTPPLRAIPYGGSPIAIPDIERAARVFPGALVQFYGLAEALAPISVLSAAEHDRALTLEDPRERARVLGSAGRPIPEIDLGWREAELSVRGLTVTGGYWRRPDLNRETLTGDGWFQTGDLARLDDEGLLHIIGRGSQTIISGGFNIHAGEVERVISGVPGVREVAVFGMPHPVWGEGVAAAIVPTVTVTSAAGPGPRPLDPALLAAVLAACEDNLAGYKKPVLLRALPELPRNSSEKIDRRELRRLLNDTKDEHNAGA